MLTVPLWGHTRNALWDCIRYKLYKLVLQHMDFEVMTKKRTFFNLIIFHYIFGLYIARPRCSGHSAYIKSKDKNVTRSPADHWHRYLEIMSHLNAQLVPILLGSRISGLVLFFVTQGIHLARF